MAGLLRGVAEGARGLFVHESDEELDDAGVEALLVRQQELAFEPCRSCLTSQGRSAWTAASPRKTDAHRSQS